MGQGAKRDLEGQEDSRASIVGYRPGGSRGISMRYRGRGANDAAGIYRAGSQYGEVVASVSQRGGAWFGSPGYSVGERHDARQQRGG